MVGGTTPVPRKDTQAGRPPELDMRQAEPDTDPADFGFTTKSSQIEVCPGRFTGTGVAVRKTGFENVIFEIVIPRSHALRICREPWPSWPIQTPPKSTVADGISR